MAVCKTGHKVLYSSQLNSLAVHLSLLDQTKCNTIFTAVGVNVTDILRARSMSAYAVPELDDLLDLEDRMPHFPYTKTFEEAVHDPCACFEPMCPDLCVLLCVRLGTDSIWQRYDTAYKWFDGDAKASCVCSNAKPPQYPSRSLTYAMVVTRNLQRRTIGIPML